LKNIQIAKIQIRKIPNIENVRILEKFRNNGPAKPINQRRKPKKKGTNEDALREPSTMRPLWAANRREWGKLLTNLEPIAKNLIKARVLSRLPM
jgi:hypothetical protein